MFCGGGRRDIRVGVGGRRWVDGWIRAVGRGGVVFIVGGWCEMECWNA